MATYVAVPGNAMARWLLPAKSPEIGMVLASWSPYRKWSRVGWTAVCAANRLGRTADIPGVSVIEVEGTRGADWESLGWRGSEPPVTVIYLGTPGPLRKSVVHLVDRASGRCKAVVKVPLTEAAKAAVLHEAEVLQALANERYEFSPRLLHVDWGRAITTQTFVEGSPGARKLTPECWQLLQSLLLPGETTTLADHAGKWMREIGSAEVDGRESQEYNRHRRTARRCSVAGMLGAWRLRALECQANAGWRLRAAGLGRLRSEEDCRCRMRITFCICRTGCSTSVRDCTPESFGTEPSGWDSILNSAPPWRPRT